MPNEPLPLLREYNAILFDLDGVLTPTSDLHRLAWNRTLTTFFEEHGARPYKDEDYFRYIDGLPRLQAIANILESRGIGQPNEKGFPTPNDDIIFSLGKRKNAIFMELLSKGIEPYETSLSFLKYVKRMNFDVAVVSSSKNATHVLDSAKLSEYFTIVVDGITALNRRLRGKPAPDTYLHAARLLDQSPSRCVVIEDAPSGVEAGAAGNFGLVVGIDRGAGSVQLRAAGADLIVTNLGQIANVTM